MFTHHQAIKNIIDKLSYFFAISLWTNLIGYAHNNTGTPLMDTGTCATLSPSSTVKMHRCNMHFTGNTQEQESLDGYVAGCTMSRF